jgi:hypothetical protein
VRVGLADETAQPLRNLAESPDDGFNPVLALRRIHSLKVLLRVAKRAESENGAPEPQSPPKFQNDWDCCESNRETDEKCHGPQTEAIQQKLSAGKGFQRLEDGNPQNGAKTYGPTSEQRSKTPPTGIWTNASPAIKN